VDVAPVVVVVDVEVGAVDETVDGHAVFGVDEAGDVGAVVLVAVVADAMVVPDAEAGGDAAVPIAGEVAGAVQLVAVVVVAAVFVVAVAVGVVTGVVDGAVGAGVGVMALVVVDGTGIVGGCGAGVVGAGIVGGGGAGVVGAGVVGAGVVGADGVGSVGGVVPGGVLGGSCVGGGGCWVGGGGATTRGGTTGAGTGRGTSCGIHGTDAYGGGFTVVVRVVPEDVRGVIDTHGALDGPDEEAACWPAISEEKSATPGAPAAGPVQYR
jgi:hypothetical protein